MGTFPKSQPNFKQRFEKLVSQTNKLKGKNMFFIQLNGRTGLPHLLII
jgi:hypothetical protein